MLQRKYAPLLLLVAGVAGYILLASYLSVLRCEELYCRNWDLGIFEQSLWSTTHGQVMWEAGDYETFGVYSFFQIHPSLMMFPLAGLYALAPSIYTLLFFQAIVTGLAAIPLYYLARHVTGSLRLSLFTAALFLVWAPILSANLYDFHLESMFPLEFFTFAYLWVTRRYVWGTITAMLANLTLELGAILVVFILLYLCWDLFVSGLRDLRAGLGFAGWWRRLTGEEHRVFTWSSLLALSSVLVYVLLRLLQGPYIALILGHAPPVIVSYGFTPGSLNLSIDNLGGSLGMKVGYWILALALLGFVPMRRLSTLVMSVPWMLFTLLSPYQNTSRLGYSYGYIIAVPLFLAFVFSVVPFVCWLESVFEAPPTASVPSPTGRRGVPGRAVVIALLVVVLGINAVLSPVDPLMQRAGVPGASDPGYWLSYTPAPGYAAVQHLASEVPSNATVLASDDLFPFVANDLNAYSAPFTPMNLTYPDGSLFLFRYIFVSALERASMPPYLLDGWVTGPCGYLLIGSVASTPAGEVDLYEWHSDAGCPV